MAEACVPRELRMTRRSSLRRLVFSASAWLGLLVGPSLISAQDEVPVDRTRDGPTLGATLGIGNGLGWPGASVEYFVLPGRLSASVGLGYLPEAIFDGRPGSAAYSAGIRGYLGSPRHRAALELSFSLVYFEWATQAGALVASRDDYGPGLSAVYRYTTDGDLYFEASLGVGWAGRDGLAEAVGISGAPGGRPATPIGSIGFGYTLVR